MKANAYLPVSTESEMSVDAGGYPRMRRTDRYSIPCEGNGCWLCRMQADITGETADYWGA